MLFLPEKEVVRENLFSYLVMNKKGDSNSITFLLHVIIGLVLAISSIKYPMHQLVNKRPKRNNTRFFFISKSSF